MSEALLVREAGEILAELLDLGLDILHLAAVADTLDLGAEHVALGLVDVDAGAKDAGKDEEAGAADQHVDADRHRNAARLGDLGAVAGRGDEAGHGKSDRPQRCCKRGCNLLDELLGSGVDALAAAQRDELVDIRDIVHRHIGEL